MKVNELFEASRIVDLRDPDHAPGAMDREAEARMGLDAKLKVSAENLNKLAKKFKLGGGWKVGENRSISGTFVMPDGSTSNVPFKTNVSKTDAVFWNRGRYDDLTFTINGADLTREQKAEAKAKALELMPSLYAHNININSDGRRDFKSVSFHFGHPVNFADKKTYAGLVKFFTYLKTLSFS